MPEEEYFEFEKALERPLKKSIRINTNKISVEDFFALAKEKEWTLTSSNFWKNMVYIDREKDLNIALGSTFEHIMGMFYVQEVAASSSPYFMSQDKVDEGEYTILDVSASPWWKTTELAEYYPNSIIVANEFDKPRIKQLFTNVERMWNTNIAVTNYDGRFFKSVEETFDKVLLDAPCSWEGTCYKGTDAVKFWNIKNIRTIAKLQFALVEAALRTLKVWGEVVFSTCTLNRLENEWVLDKIAKKYSEYIEFENIEEGKLNRRLWPHKDKTGGFFVAKIRKIKSLPENGRELKAPNNSIERFSRKEEKAIVSKVKEMFEIDISNMFFYKYWSEVYVANRNFGDLLDKLFFFKVGAKIWEYINNDFKPDFHLGTIFDIKENKINIDVKDIDTYLKGFDLDNKDNLKDWFYWAKFGRFNAWIVEVREWQIKNMIPTKLVRK